jgi:predicted Zn-dependent peptidase
MKKLYTCFLLALLLTAVSFPAMAQQSPGSKIIEGFEYPELKWSVPEVGKEVQREVLDNGIILYLMEDHRLPLLNISARIRCGEAYLPKEKMAIPQITGEVMRSGGTISIDADSLNALLELIGGRLETSIGFENGSASLNVMSKDTELGLRLMADVLRNPAFPEEKIDLSKTQIKSNIKRRNDNPSRILSREYYNLIYGDHPDGRILEWEYVAPITRQDLADYHQAHFAPNNIMLGITGDFDSGEIKTLLNRYFGDWEKKEISLPEIPDVDDTPHPGVYQIYKDVNQASIRFGHLGVSRDNPDRYAVSVMNYILGGGSFTSRMTSKVRSDEGLSYSVGTRYQTSTRDLGVWYAFCQTKLSTTYKAMRLMLDEVERIRDGEVTDEELESAKDSYINRHVFNFTTPSQIVNRLMELEFEERPPDLLKKYIDNIRMVTKEDVLRVANEYLKPENITYVVVGDPEKFEKPLDEFGSINNIEIQPPVLE